MNGTRRFTFQNKLFAGFGLMALLLVTLIFIGSRIIQEASFQLTQIFHTEVQPLAKVNRLQSQINRLQLKEINLPRVEGYFAVVSEIDLIHSEMGSFTRNLEKFEIEMKALYPLQTQALMLNWNQLKTNLLEVTKQAKSMNMVEARRISTHESSTRFVNISRTLQTMAESIDASSHKANNLAIQALERRHRLFVMTAIAAVVIGSVSIFLFARSLSRRVRDLRDASRRIADGEMDQTIEISGDDELTDLAVAFNTMKQQIKNRETALNQARDFLEQRVHERTLELYNSAEHLTQEVEQRKKVQDSLRILSQAVRQSPVSIVITDSNGDIEYVNEAFTAISGFRENEVLGRNPRLLSSGETPSAIFKKLWTAILSGNEWEGELYNRRKDGSLYWEYTHISPVYNEENQITHFLAIKQDITERRQQEQKILHQAQFDSLTDLPNRTLAMDRLSHTIAQAQRNDNKVILMFIDLDNFKRINDNLGHEVGDQLLIQAAKRLTHSVRQEDTVARLGGDEFLIIAGGLTDRSDVDPIINNILKTFSSAFSIGGSEQVVTPSIGLALFPDDGETTSMLLRNADLAMYQAKEDGRNTYHYFNRSIQEKMREKLELESELRHALNNNEMQVQYQVIVDANSRKPVSVEALLRWHSNKFGLVMPDRFIDIAEQTGLIEPIGEWVIETACRQVKAWQDSGFSHLSLSVNVSPRQFRGNRLLTTIRNCLKRTHFPAAKLTLEMTEGLLIRNPPEARQLLAELDKQGIRLAMDDFGTGYSSLSYLKKYPFHILKIDRSFIRDIIDDPDDRALVSAAIRMGQGLGLRVVAEGVESLEQVELLSTMSCDLLQGHLFGKPQNPEDLKELLANCRNQSLKALKQQDKPSC
ncbi:EAL domain-containing protein [Motiliproteus sp. MSK22-1]|uniref:EAL domain-containing protein n=1 Tax=Motiliproteus sp. MSK22-1 TaxID=1897630 RepID=UPI000975FB91|nr:EAL domain-containing protein [Motiliproteus sp. MSK22-1]OMH31801.1 hypothetical protein BGP75_16945 [Motiliproteus sp. MSK22-1]